MRTLPIGPEYVVPYSVSAYGAKDGARVQARAATDAVKRVALFGVGEQIRAAIIQKHDVKFFRAGELVGPRGPPIKVL